MQRARAALGSAATRDARVSGGTASKLADEPRLPDPGLALEKRAAELARLRTAPEVDQLRHLASTTDEGGLLGRQEGVERRRGPFVEDAERANARSELRKDRVAFEWLAGELVAQQGMRVSRD